VKKFLVILLLLIYSGSTFGATVHLHYCMNELVGWTLWHHGDKEKCGKCGMSGKKSGCCKDEHKSFKVKTEHQKGDVAKLIQPVLTPVIAIPAFNYSDNISYRPVTISYPVSHAPPLEGTPLFIQYCVFLI
jgi:hypothetical protein